MGYNYKAVGQGLTVKNTWPESDLEMMEKTVHEYIGNEPFHAYYMTVSGHMLYTFSGNSMASKNREYVKTSLFRICQSLPSYSNRIRPSFGISVKGARKGWCSKYINSFKSDHYPYGLEHDALEELADIQ